MSKGDDESGDAGGIAGQTLDTHTFRLQEIIEQEMYRRGVTYEVLAAQLTMPGKSAINARQLSGQVMKGGLSAGTLLHILDYLGIDALRLDTLKMEQEVEERISDENTNRR